MRTGTHSCSCGSRFGLRVELAVHCELTAHQPVRDELPAPVVAAEPTPEPAAPAVKKARRPLGRKARALVATALLLSFLGFNAMMQKAVSTCTTLETTLATQLVSP